MTYRFPLKSPITLQNHVIVLSKHLVQRLPGCPSVSQSLPTWKRRNLFIFFKGRIIHTSLNSYGNSGISEILVNASNPCFKLNVFHVFTAFQNSTFLRVLEDVEADCNAESLANMPGRAEPVVSVFKTVLQF